jgi:hypothetical protein
MRGRTFKIRQVFVELRYALGNEIPSIEVLKLATNLVDATRATSISNYDKIVTLRPSRDQPPLDEAFADGGWGIMARDWSYSPEQFDEDSCLSARAKSTLDQLMKRAA